MQNLIIAALVLFLVYAVGAYSGFKYFAYVLKKQARKRRAALEKARDDRAARLVASLSNKSKYHGNKLRNQIINKLQQSEAARA